LFWSPEYGYAAGDVAGLTHERDQLREWLGSVPPPPALDPTGPVPAEVERASSQRASG
jgi:NADH-quinone oxidoreductase subunit I